MVENGAVLQDSAFVAKGIFSNNNDPAGINVLQLQRRQIIYEFVFIYRFYLP